MFIFLDASRATAPPARLVTLRGLMRGDVSSTSSFITPSTPAKFPPFLPSVRHRLTHFCILATVLRALADTSDTSLLFLPLGLLRPSTLLAAPLPTRVVLDFPNDVGEPISALEPCRYSITPRPLCVGVRPSYTETDTLLSLLVSPSLDSRSRREGTFLLRGFAPLYPGAEAPHRSSKVFSVRSSFGFADGAG